MTILMKACFNKDTQIFLELLERGADEDQLSKVRSFVNENELHDISEILKARTVTNSGGAPSQPNPELTQNQIDPNKVSDQQSSNISSNATAPEEIIDQPKLDINQINSSEFSDQQNPIVNSDNTNLDAASDESKQDMNLNHTNPDEIPYELNPDVNIDHINSAENSDEVTNESKIDIIQENINTGENPDQSPETNSDQINQSESPDQPMPDINPEQIIPDSNSNRSINTLKERFVKVFTKGTINDALKLLEESQISIEARDDYSDIRISLGLPCQGTPLIHASYAGNFDVVNLLIDKGANVNAKDKDKRRKCKEKQHWFSQA